VRALGRAAPSPFLLAYVSPNDITEHVTMAKPDAAGPTATGLSTTQSGVALSAGAQKGVVRVVLDIPTSQARNITTLLRKAKHTPAVPRRDDAPSNRPSPSAPRKPPTAPPKASR